MKKRTLYSDHSWMVEFSPEENCVVIATSDYHAGPLKMTAKQWEAFGRQFAKGGPEPDAPARSARGGPARFGDLGVVAGNESLTVSISRRERRVIIQPAGPGAVPLAITRRELYRIGRSMGRKGAKRGGRSAG